MMFKFINNQGGLNAQGGFAPLDYTPTILVNIADDDVTRGDTAGRKGLAREMAKKTGAKILYADQKTLSDAYPHLDKSDYRGLLAKYLENENAPTTVIGFRCDDSLEQVGHDPRSIYYVTSYNEDLSQTLLKERELVAHHHTPETLEQEGQRFDEFYKDEDIKSTLISIFLVNPQPSNQEDFSQRLTSIAAQYPEATIFLCGSRRTDGGCYDQLVKTIEKKLKKINEGREQGEINLRGFKFDREAEFNPYKGLMARSDHFVVWGDSRSMMSEPLMTGKSVHVYDYWASTEKLEKKKKVIRFDTCNPNKPFNTKTFTPVNLTEQLADAVLKEEKKHETKYRKGVRIGLDPSIQSDWREPLVSIRASYHNAARLPEHLQNNVDFALQSVGLNGFSLRYFSTVIQANLDVAKRAITQNKWAVKFVGEDLKDNADFMTYACNKDSELFHQASPRLQQNKDFVIGLLEDNPYIYNYCAAELREDLDIIATTVTTVPHFFSEIPEEHQSNIALIKRCMKKQPGIFAHLSDSLKEREDLIDLAIKTEIPNNNYAYLPPAFREREDLFQIALKNNQSAFSSAPKKFRAKPEYIEQVIQKDASLIRYADPSALQDIELAKRLVQINAYSCWQALPSEVAKHKDVASLAIQKNPDLYNYASDDVRNDPDIALIYLTDNPHSTYNLPHHLLSENRDLALKVALLPGVEFHSIHAKYKKDFNFMDALISSDKNWQDEKKEVKEAYKQAKAASIPKAGALTSLFNILNPSGNNTPPTSTQKKKTALKQ